jgi:Ca2+-binding EF-hand superfamily protein
MRVRTVLVTLVVASLAAVSALAEQPQKASSCKTKLTVQERFTKMDVNHDGVLSQPEFINAHKDKAATWSKAAFKKMGGTELTVDQITAARDNWEKEFAARHTGWKPTMTDEEVFETMDSKHTERVSESEFVSYWVTQAADHARDTFAKMGGSNDKGLTFAQYETGVKDLEKPSLFILTGFQRTK